MMGLIATHKAVAPTKRSARWATLALRLVFPAVAAGLPIFLSLYGAPIAAVFALIAGIVLVAQGYTVRRPLARFVQGLAATTFVLAAFAGMPRAAYDFSTASCLGEAADLRAGDVRSLSDPRLAPETRAWVERTHALLALSWPRSELPALDIVAIANVAVKAPALVTELQWRGDSGAATSGLWPAKEAFAARYYDRRLVCHLYHGGERSAGNPFLSAEAKTVAQKTEEALALVIAAMQTTYEPAASAQQVAAVRAFSR